MIRRAIFIAISVLLLPVAARADCTNPAHVEGKIVYNTNNKLLQYCDGIDWVPMHSPGSGSGGCTNPDRPEQYVAYNADARVLQACAGTQWRAMGPVGGTGGGGAPDWSTPANGPPLNNPSPNTNDYFADGVAVSGNVAVVGDGNDESDGDTGTNNAGRAYVFDITTGNLIVTLDNPSPNANDLFGVSVAVSGSTAVVGAFYDESDGGTGVSAAGRAYVFDTATGNLISTLNNPSPDVDDWFGVSVAVSGNTAVVGARQDEADGGTGVSNAGRAYVFDTTTGNLVSTLNNPSPNVDDLFGYSVAVSGSVAVVSAYQDEADGGAGISNAGRAYVFDTVTGNLISTLNNPSPNTSDNFGRSVAISETIAVVGADNDESDGGTGVSAAGRAYVFDTATGTLISILNNPSPNASDGFGNAVAVSGATAVVATRGDESDGAAGVSNAGRAYIFNAGGALLTGCTSPDRPAGAMVYNQGGRRYQYCDGANWVMIGPPNYSAIGLSFTDLTDIAVTTLTTSDIVPLSGFFDSLSVSIAGDGSPQYRICSDGSSEANCDGSEVQTWTSASGSLTAGQYIQLRLTSNAANNTMNSATITVGTGSDQWDVTTVAGDPCAGSPSPGDLCADGSYYIGQVAGNAIYATDATSQLNKRWNNNSTNWTVTGFTSTMDGAGNTAGLVALSDAGAPYAAAVYCDGLTNVHGHSDWYLPAEDELNLFWNGGAPVAGVLVSGALYWTSTESTNSTARIQRFSDGTKSIIGKNTSRPVRCVRK